MPSLTEMILLMLVLASASPRRRELLMQAGYSFKVAASEISEIREPGEDPVRFTTRLAREKAQSVFNRLQTAENAADFPTAGEGSTLRIFSDPILVLGADTVVIVEGEILGKPTSPDDARRMLWLLSGRTHQVITGVSLVAAGVVETAAELTYVSVRALSEDEIVAYVSTGEPLDKAGAYAIQGYAARWVPRIQGCYFNVVGLPLALITSMIEGVEARLSPPPSSSRESSVPSYAG